MKNILISLAALVCFSVAADAQTSPTAIPSAMKIQPTVPSAPKEIAINPGGTLSAATVSRKVEFAQMPLSFEPNVGQSDSAAGFTAKSLGYTLQLEATTARLQFAAAQAGAERKTLTMEMVGGNPASQVRGEEQLLGKDNYFPGSDPKSWFSNIPTYSR